MSHHHSLHPRRASLLRLLPATMLVALVLGAAFNGRGQRRVTPVNTPATTTQHINATAGDTARINAVRRATMAHYLNENGFTVYVDTLDGTEWIDSTSVLKLPKMKYPLLQDLSIGVNIWDGVMRAFGQKYGLGDISIKANLHNRYQPTFEVGLGMAKNTPAALNFTYRSPLAPYFRLGADYNILYNSNPDYQFLAGLRYGFSRFNYALDNVTITNGYWQQDIHTSIPSQSSTAGWLEVCLGLKVKLVGPVSAGWTFKYHKMLHLSKAAQGQPWYIPGFGTRGSNIAAAFSIYYTLPVGANKKASQKVNIADADTSTDNNAATQVDINAQQ